MRHYLLNIDLVNMNELTINISSKSDTVPPKSAPMVKLNIVKNYLVINQERKTYSKKVFRSTFS